MAHRTFKTLLIRCKTCNDDVRYCDCPKTWYYKNIVPRDQRLHVRFPENATVGTRYNACLAPIEIFLMFTQYMDPLTLLAMMQALYPLIMPSTIMSHLRHRASKTYKLMHDFLLCLETGAVLNNYYEKSYGTLPSCFGFSCIPPIEYIQGTCKHTCQCGFTYDISWMQEYIEGPISPTINFEYMSNNAYKYLDMFTCTFDYWTGPKMGSYDYQYADTSYEERENELDLIETLDTARFTKERVKSVNKSHDREKKLMCAHKNARTSRRKIYYTKGRNTPNRYRDLTLV